MEKNDTTIIIIQKTCTASKSSGNPSSLTCQNINIRQSRNPFKSDQQVAKKKSRVKTVGFCGFIEMSLQYFADVTVLGVHDIELSYKRGTLQDLGPMIVCVICFLFMNILSCVALWNYDFCRSSWKKH